MQQQQQQQKEGKASTNVKRDSAQTLKKSGEIVEKKEKKIEKKKEQKKEAEKEEAEDDFSCPTCGEQNKPNYKACDGCGMPRNWGKK